MSNNAARADEGFGVMSSRGSFIELSTVELKPASAYELIFDSKGSEDWELVLVDDASGSWIKQIGLEGEERISGLFRTFESNRVRLLVRGEAGKTPGMMLISKISIREVGGL
jgi:hypothetical protein